MKKNDREIDDIKKKTEQSLMGMKNIMDYVRVNENHLDEIEKRLSYFVKHSDMKEIRYLKENIRIINNKIEKIEEGSIVPLLS